MNGNITENRPKTANIHNWCILHSFCLIMVQEISRESPENMIFIPETYFSAPYIAMWPKSQHWLVLVILTQFTVLFIQNKPKEVIPQNTLESLQWSLYIICAIKWQNAPETSWMPPQQCYGMIMVLIQPNYPADLL